MKTKVWQTQIDQITHAAQEAFANLSPEDLNWKPHSESWSVAQCLDHLIVINQTYFPMLAQLREGTYRAPWHAQFPFLTRFFGNFVLKSVQPDRAKKMKTFPIWMPAQSDLPADIVALFAKHQEELKNQIQQCEDLIARGVVIASPASGVIVYKLETAFDIIVTHEQRHLNQAQEVVGLMNMHR